MKLRALALSISVTVGVGAFAPPAQAYDPPYVWAGMTLITAATALCTGKWGVGNRLESMYRAKLQSGEQNSALAVNVFGAAGVFKTTSTTSQLHGSGSYTAATYGTTYVNMGSSTGTYKLVLKPTTVTKNTELVEIKGTIKDFFGTAGCDVTVHGSYVLKN